jgi:hypothetical protein
MIITRQWAMPNKNTFDILPIKNLINKYFSSDVISVDPFANTNKLAKYTNDICTEYDTNYHLDALDFLKILEDNSIDFIFYDPPYSPRQVSEVYIANGKSVNMQTTQSSYWSKHKKQIQRIVKPNGLALSCSWNSGGIGIKYGFEIIEVLLVPHGGWHNDTICVVERKIK